MDAAAALEEEASLLAAVQAVQSAAAADASGAEERLKVPWHCLPAFCISHFSYCSIIQSICSMMLIFCMPGHLKRCNFQEHMLCYHLEEGLNKLHLKHGLCHDVVIACDKDCTCQSTVITSVLE